MAAGWPTKVSYANGDVYSASDVNDTNGTLNYIDPTSAADGQVLTRDAASPGKVKWASSSGSPFVAGKNKFINGDFGIWQRGTSFNGDSQYTADRFVTYSDSGGTVSQQTFTPGTAPVSGYEGTYYLRSVRSSGGTFASIVQKIEDVRIFAGQTFTISFWAKASASQTITIRPQQVFGTGGSSNVIIATNTVNATTSWARYSSTFTGPSISGKTIGTNSNLYAELYWLTSSAVTVELWGMQIEYGSTATDFTTSTGSVQGELAACQRYYWRQTGGYAYSGYGTGAAQSTTNAQVIIPLPVTMRVNPASIDYSTLALFDLSTVRAVTAASILTSSSSQNTAYCDFTVASGLTQYRPQYVVNNNNTAGYIGFSAEL